MQTPKIANNSYFFSASTNKRFTDYLDKKMSSYRKPSSAINWWTKKSSNIMHCTLGTLYGKQPQSAEAVDTIKKIASKTIGDVPSMLTTIESCDVTKNGWVILKMQPKNELKIFHDKFIEKSSKVGVTPSKFDLLTFMPHVSIGSLKPGADVNEAKRELNQLLQDIKNDPSPFMLYDVSLTHTDAKGSTETIVQKSLKRRNIDILKVEPSGNKYEVKVKSKESAKKLANIFKKYYNIESAKQPGLPKTVKKGKNCYTLLLNKNEFNKTAGHFQKLNV
jgi:hypothetical protein